MRPLINRKAAGNTMFNSPLPAIRVKAAARLCSKKPEKKCYSGLQLLRSRQDLWLLPLRQREKPIVTSTIGLASRQVRANNIRKLAILGCDFEIITRQNRLRNFESINHMGSYARETFDHKADSLLGTNQGRPAFPVLSAAEPGIAG